jgi:SAM-dependent methyltransferase
MKFFADTVIKPYVLENGYKRFCEIGASFGENTDKLLEIDSVHVTIIDPCLDVNLCEKYRNDSRVEIHKGNSLDVLPNLSKQFDCVLIDGDHNWFTVFNELKLIEEKGLIKRGGTIFLHDVLWPYGRRDMYYQPEIIPSEFKQSYDTKGIVKGQSELSDNSGVNSAHYNALFEGGPKNGVLTAVEDFIKAHNGYKFFHVEEQFGLGVLLKKKSLIGSGVFVKWLMKIKYPKQLERIRNSGEYRAPKVYRSVSKAVDVVLKKL